MSRLRASMSRTCAAFFSGIPARSKARVVVAGPSAESDGRLSTQRPGPRRDLDRPEADKRAARSWLPGPNTNGDLVEAAEGHEGVAEVRAEERRQYNARMRAYVRLSRAYTAGTEEELGRTT